VRGAAGARRLLAGLGLGKALQAVVGDRLPGGGVGDERAEARAHAGIAVEGAHAHAHLRLILGVAAEQMRAALAAEALLEASLGMAPPLHRLLSFEQPQGAAVDPHLRGGCRTGTPLAARAVAVAGFGRRCGQLEADRAAQAASAERRSVHRGCGSITANRYRFSAESAPPRARAR